MGLANWLTVFVPYVVLRIVRTDHDPSPDCHSTNDQVDYWRGIQAFYEGFWWDTYQQASPHVILQYNNETNWRRDDRFFCGLMYSASREGRRVVIYNDSVGATEDDMWLARRDSLIMAREQGHYAGLHAYGLIDGTYHPMTAWDSPGAWRWYAGRYEHLYSLMPGVQPPLILTECGSGGDQTAGGVDSWLRDVRVMDAKALATPYLVSYNWWTMGAGGAYGFDRDKLDDFARRLL